MERNDIRAAIATDDYRACKALWQEWDLLERGTDFYEFITRPSAARTRFLRESGRLRHEFAGSVLVSKI